MASPAVASNPGPTNSERVRARKKKKKINPQLPKHPYHQQNWKSETRQQIYSSKLLKALRHVGGSGTAAPRRGTAVREAADRELAATAKGRSRWSRAVLTSRLKLKCFRKIRSSTARVPAPATGSSRSKKPRVSVYRLKGKSLPAVQRKVRVLGRLVPGCRKQPLPVILEETYDYIEAKHMQIRAMTELLDRLAGSISAASASGSGD